jgi:hypothetical protein
MVSPHNRTFLSVKREYAAAYGAKFSRRMPGLQIVQPYGLLVPAIAVRPQLEAGAPSTGFPVQKQPITKII